MSQSLKDALSQLKGSKIEKVANDAEPGRVRLSFSDGSALMATYWRIIKDGRAILSSFDDQQKFGLSATTDAVKELQGEITSLEVSHASIDNETGDLSFELSSKYKIQIFNFTGYEVWELAFPDGSRVYSNYALE